MPDFLVPYGSTLAAYVCLAGVYVVQGLVSDVVAIRAGHVPGMPVTTGHDDFLFRATRAQANTNENLPIFVLLSLSAVFLGASTTWTNGLTWTFAVSRAAHMLAYYANLRTLRSAIFGVTFASLIGLLALSVAALCR